LPLPRGVRDLCIPDMEIPPFVRSVMMR